MIWIFQRVQRGDGEGGSLKREHFVNDHTKFIIFLYFKGLSKIVYGARSFAFQFGLERVVHNLNQIVYIDKIGKSE